MSERLPGEAGKVQAWSLAIDLQQRIVTCFICGCDADHTAPQNRKCVPIWNGDYTTSNAEKVDGYMPACIGCYGDWDAWDERIRARMAELASQPPRQAITAKS